MLIVFSFNTPCLGSAVVLRARFVYNQLNAAQKNVFFGLAHSGAGNAHFGSLVLISVAHVQ